MFGFGLFAWPFGAFALISLDTIQGPTFNYCLSFIAASVLRLLFLIVAADNA
jgi:hypothetical protein